jgi:hypothetical protein
MNPLLLLPAADEPVSSAAPAPAGPAEPPRLRRPDRRQLRLEPTVLEDGLPGDHSARTLGG